LWGKKKKKTGSILFDRPKPTAGCSANGRRRSRIIIIIIIIFYTAV